MNNLLRGAVAGAAAWKFGGGLISTILIFVLVFWLLGDVRFHRLSFHIEAALERCTNFPLASGSNGIGEVGFSPGFEF